MRVTNSGGMCTRTKVVEKKRHRVKKVKSNLTGHETVMQVGCCGCFMNVCKGKGKAVPLQAWSGPEVSRKLRLPDFVTTAQDGGKVVSLTHRPIFTPRK